MAKLSAHGRTTLIRMVKDMPADGALLRGHKYFALMSDGHVLIRTVAWFKDEYAPKGERRNDFGWKDMGKSKTNVTPEQFQKTCEAKGYRLDP